MKKLYSLLLLANISIAAEVDKDFYFHGKPIDPYCIFLSNTSQIVNLDACTKHNILSIDSFKSSDSEMVGYSYHTIKDSIPGSMVYNYLGKYKNTHAIHADMIGGLTSRLNFIKYYQIIDGKLILVKSGPSGDRSHGGLSNTKMENGSVYYDMSLTPKLFTMYFNKSGKHIDKIENLLDCAICHFAYLHFKDEKIMSISLSPQKSILQGNKLEQCFNHIHQQYIDSSKLNLDEKDAYSFANEVITKCIKNK